jgi:hypothetical protein
MARLPLEAALCRPIRDTARETPALPAAARTLWCAVAHEVDALPQQFRAKWKPDWLGSAG